MTDFPSAQEARRLLGPLTNIPPFEEWFAMGRAAGYIGEPFCENHGISPDADPDSPRCMFAAVLNVTPPRQDPPDENEDRT